MAARTDIRRLAATRLRGRSRFSVAKARRGARPGGMGKRTRLPVASAKTRPRRAIITTEIVVSLFLMAALAALAADTIFEYHRTSSAYLWRRAAVWAVDAQLQRYHAGAPVDSQPPQGMIPERITLSSTREPGREEWQGFNRVTIDATVHLPTGKVIHERGSTYVPAEAKP